MGAFLKSSHDVLTKVLAARYSVGAFSETTGSAFFLPGDKAPFPAGLFGL